MYLRKQLPKVLPRDRQMLVFYRPLIILIGNQCMILKVSHTITGTLAQVKFLGLYLPFTHDSSEGVHDNSMASLSSFDDKNAQEVSWKKNLDTIVEEEGADGGISENISAQTIRCDEISNLKQINPSWSQKKNIKGEGGVSHSYLPKQKQQLNFCAVPIQSSQLDKKRINQERKFAKEAAMAAQCLIDSLSIVLFGRTPPEFDITIPMPPTPPPTPPNNNTANVLNNINTNNANNANNANNSSTRNWNDRRRV